MANIIKWLAVDSRTFSTPVSRFRARWRRAGEPESRVLSQIYIDIKEKRRETPR